jgi:hypothetical protein
MFNIVPIHLPKVIKNIKILPGSVIGESLQINIVAVLSKAINALPVAVKHAELIVFERDSHFDLSVMLRCPTLKEPQGMLV